MALTEMCGIIFPRRNDIDDETGCLKPRAHHDHHVCRNRRGELIAWEDDYECTCGCWDEDDGDPCAVYWEVKSITE